jgi:lipid A oxidase
MKTIVSWFFALLALVCLDLESWGQVPEQGIAERSESPGAGDAPLLSEQDGPVYVWEEKERRPRGETQLAVYGGQAWTQSSDVRFHVNGNTDMTYHDVPWFTDPFGTPPYYGFRATHFFAPDPHWGLMLDFAHDKMLAEMNTPLELTGVRNGQPIHTVETLGQTLSHFQFTDGINFLTLNAVYRVFLFPTESRPRGWFQPYIGGGMGVSIPTMETTFIGKPDTHRYEWRGPAFQAVAGTHVVLLEHVSLFFEYKFNNVVVNGNLNEGTLRTVVNSHQFIFGPSLNW